jgi:ATP-dependent DNA helicase RecG
MTPEQLQAKLDELRALPGETEWVEFKHAERNYDFDDLGKYFSALSNEANLKGQPFGWLGFGIRDKTHEIVGTRFRSNRPQLDSLKQEVAVQTTNRLTFEEIHELATPQGRVILFQIPAASRGSPTAWKGHFYGRNGESLGALSLRGD